jgi:hypothetical protein
MSSWVVAGVILTGAWTQLDEIGWAGWIPLLATLALDRLTAPRFPRVTRTLTAPAALPVLAGSLLCALVLAHVALTAREEFGFGGDEGYHLSATRAFALYYMRAGPILAVVLAIYAVWRWQRWPCSGAAAMLALMAGSYLLPASALFARYPNGFYHLATPLNVIFDVAQIPYPHAANHIVNGLSVPAWLFVLRPLIIGRWPDWQVLPVALLIYFQAPALTFLASTLIEPWAIVFLLLSIEALVVFQPGDRWIAVLLAAIATWFKETAILLLPTIWLLGCVEWRGLRPTLRDNAIAAGVAAIVPFFSYYMVRVDAEIHRTVTVATAADIWRLSRIGEWTANVIAQLGPSALVGLALVFAFTARHLVWALTTIGLVLFFFVDALGIPYTGYGRYQAFSLIALCGAVIATTHHGRDRRAPIAMAAIIAALQAVPVARAFALDFQPDYERNSLEWNGSLVRLPIRELATRIPDARDGGQISGIRIVSFGIELISVPVAYPDLAARYALTLEQQDASAVDCRCRDSETAVLAAFEWPAHFGDTPAKRSTFEQVSAACVSQINTTCGSTILEQRRDGAIVGALGVGEAVLMALPQHDQRPER